MRSWMVIVAILTLGLLSLGAAAQDDLPQLQHFSPDEVDKTLDPCNNFFQYACSKWNKAYPIPADQVGWGTFNALAIWNVAAVHDTLESAAKVSSSRTPVEVQAG